jgi:membrane protein DedA with SNARE-associated domain
MDPHELSELVGAWGYLALLALFLATGVGSPIPEDVLLMTTGYLLFAGALEWPAAWAVALAGVVASDLILFLAGRQAASRASRRQDDHFLSRARLSAATRWFDRAGDPLILLARLVPGTRAVVFFTAGLRSVPASTFLVYDGVGALVWVPAMLAVGQAAGPRLGELEMMVERVQSGAFWVLLAAAGLLVLWRTRGREQSKL